MGKRTQETKDAIDRLNNSATKIDNIKQLQNTKLSDEAVSLIQAYEAVFSSDHGKLVLADMMAKSNFNYTAFSMDNARLTDFTLGKQSAIHDIQHMRKKGIK